MFRQPSRALLAMPLALLLAAASCGRSLELPAAPDAPDGPTPRFLGELSGTYALGVRFPLADGNPLAGLLMLDGGVLPVAGGSATLLQIPAGDGGADEIAGYLAGLQRGAGEPSCDPFQSFLAGGALLLGTFGEGRIDAELLAPGGAAPRLSGHRAAAGAGLAVDYQACGSGAPTELFAVPVCAWDPKFSGVYEGSSGSCDAPAGSAVLAVGIRTGAFAAVEAPAGRKVTFGLHHALDDAGVATRVDLDTGALELGAFTLGEKEGELELDLRFRGVELDGCPAPVGFVEGLACLDCLRKEACAAYPDGPAGACPEATTPASCEQRFVGSRQTGTTAGECAVPESKFALSAQLDGVRDGHLVDIVMEKTEAGFGSGGPLTGGLERALIAGVLVAADGTVLQSLGPLDPRGVAGHPVSLTFDLGAGGTGKSYTLLTAAIGACVPGALACAAMPSCLEL